MRCPSKTYHRLDLDHRDSSVRGLPRDSGLRSRAHGAGAGGTNPRRVGACRHRGSLAIFPHQIALDAAIQGQPTPTDALSGVFQPYRPRPMRAVRIASTQRCRPRHPRTPPTGRDAAPSHRRDLLPEVSCPAGGRRRIPAAFRPAGVRRPPEVRLARTRVCARQVRRLPSRAPGWPAVRKANCLADCLAISPFRASDAAFVHPAAHAGWWSRPRISSITSCRSNPSASGCRPSPTRYASCSPPGRKYLSQIPGVVYRAISTCLVKKTGFTVASGAKTGAVTLIQRFGSAPNLNIHFHMLFLDGVYDFKGRRPTFHRAPRPTRAELTKLLHTIGQRVGPFARTPWPARARRRQRPPRLRAR